HGNAKHIQRELAAGDPAGPSPGGRRGSTARSAPRGRGAAWRATPARDPTAAGDRRDSRPRAGGPAIPRSDPPALALGCPSTPADFRERAGWGIIRAGGARARDLPATGAA